MSDEQIKHMIKGMTPNPNKQSVDKLDELLEEIAMSSGFYTDADLREINPEAKQAIEAHIAEEVRKARIELAQLANQHRKPASYFKPEVEVVLVSTLVWAAGLKSLQGTE